MAPQCSGTFHQTALSHYQVIKDYARDALAFFFFFLVCMMNSSSRLHVCSAGNPIYSVGAKFHVKLKYSNDQKTNPVERFVQKSVELTKKRKIRRVNFFLSAVRRENTKGGLSGRAQTKPKKPAAVKRWSLAMLKGACSCQARLVSDRQAIVAAQKPFEILAVLAKTFNARTTTFPSVSQKSLRRRTRVFPTVAPKLKVTIYKTK